MDDFLILLITISIIIVAAGLGFLTTAIFVKLICWAFGFIFSWKLVIGIWAILTLISAVFKSNGGNK